MRAIAYQAPHAITETPGLTEVDLPPPIATGHDLVVRVKAVSVNPVDTKIRTRVAAEDGGWKVLGWDAAGVVEAVGPDVTLFQPGDEVFYAGDLTRPGTNAEWHAVDERIVGPKPKSLDFAAAAALPLTAITAWEMLFDRLDVARPVAGAANAILIIGGAGGVGSIAIQLARALTGLTVIATASRPETQAWVKDLGAHHVLDHSQPLAAQVAALGLGQPAFVFSTTNTDDHYDQIVELIAPHGRFGLIDDPKDLSALPLKRKSLSLHWEFMFSRSLFATPDMIRQHELLAEVSRLIDSGTLRTTLSDTFGPISAETLKRAHALIESGKAKGKIVLTGF
ncbi:zinc-binding alcohol dehydrogenase family protein [Novispirillum itersonii]|uniref:Zinc-type alcohol dehydrogenase-like protein n=1 Tax=Novispirillum itersonii TaxID=189 RepID=A0A7X0DQ71_NOVIT|nr:zinc-binding alcohol dehydrogenase family protein [Novispirillum itersonii]MBB6211982.1 zinc-binding alcohol dehydrogenase family protein [Novispirillum itersonii]